MQNHETWMNNKWRPAMAWMYMFICVLDFAVFPILWSGLQAHFGGSVITQWDPLTLKGAGLFHMAMGAVLGITAWSRGQEKITNATIKAPTINTKLDPEDPPFRNTRND
jgi:hypothetical protein